MSGPIPGEAEPIEPLTASFEFEMEDGRKAVTSAWYYVLPDWQVKTRLTELGTSADGAIDWWTYDDIGADERV